MFDETKILIKSQLKIIKYKKTQLKQNLLQI